MGEISRGEQNVIDDANEFVRQSANLQSEVPETSGIRPHPLIEATEQTLDTTRFGFGFGPKPLATIEPESGTPTTETGACCNEGACSQTTEAGCPGIFLGVGVPCDPNPCVCPCDPDTPNFIMEKDFVEWFDPDTQPAWPNTWDANDAYSDDIQGGDDPDCAPFEHHRVRVRFVLNTPFASTCILRWNILTVQLLNDFSFVFTNNIQETVIHLGDTIVGPFEIDSPGNSGCGTAYLNYYNYPAGGSGACCINGDFCALYFTSDDCANRAGIFGGNCTDCDPGPC